MRTGELGGMDSVLTGPIKVMTRSKFACECIELGTGRCVRIVRIPVVVEIEVMNLGVSKHAPADVDRQIGANQRVHREPEEPDGGCEERGLRDRQSGVIPVVVKQVWRLARKRGRHQRRAQNTDDEQPGAAPSIFRFEHLH